ncbi:MAG: DUF4386 domain-containing protein [Myxococcales bacterium]|nr:DUF4386 domain-containing protein [Myxococcales bacterium]
MDSMHRQARIAGCWYLLFVLSGFFALMYVPGQVLVRGNPAATANNIASHEMLFRFGIVAELFAGVLALIVALVLYRLFENVDRTQAVLMVILGGLVVTPIYFVNVFTSTAALRLAGGADVAASLDVHERQIFARFFLDLHHDILMASFVFAGLWLFPLGILIYRSRFLPRFIGVWLIVEGVAWVVYSLTGFVSPQHTDRVWKWIQPAALGEIVFTLWLLIFGARRLADRPSANRSPSGVDPPS